jgi:hypothetical protein
MDAVREALEAFRTLTKTIGGKRSIACLKRALRVQGVIESCAVARGTAALPDADGERFERGLADVYEKVRECISAPWVSEFPGSSIVQER